MKGNLKSASGDQNGLLLKLSVGELVERPFDLDVGKSLGAVIPIRLDRHGTNAGSDVNRHERMAGLVIRGDIGHLLRRRDR